MEVPPVPGPDLSKVLSKGIKRKALASEDTHVKSPRVDDQAADSESDNSEYENEEIASDIPNDFQFGSSAATPLTPLSSKASPRHPSDLHKSHSCPYPNCEKSFNRPAKLTQHLRSHTNTRLFVCPRTPCTKDFLRESHLKHHIKSAHSNDRDHVCDWEGCDKRFVTATRLRRHQASHEGKEKFRCTVTACGQFFRKHATLQKHIMTVHEGRDPFVCGESDGTGQECGAGFDTEGKLKSHIGRIHGIKRFVCMICSSDEQQHEVNSGSQELRETVLHTHAALQAHLANEHPPTCTECGLQCTSQSALKSHTEVIHGGFDINERRTYICQEPNCGRGFTKKGNLNTHIHVSHAMKRFVCGKIDEATLNNVGDWDGSDACLEAFKSKANLEKHIRGKHLGLEASRKAKKKNRQDSIRVPSQTNHVPTLTRLTGARYGVGDGRVISCLIQGCGYRFVREYDHEFHLQSRHGLADFEIQDLLMERDFYSQSASPRSSNSKAEHTSGDPSALDVDYSNTMDIDDVGEPHNKAGDLNGADSWHGGNFPQRGIGGDAWSYEEAAAQPLGHGYSAHNVHGRSSVEDVDMIDPSLLSQM